jgi:fructokinase
VSVNAAGERDFTLYRAGCADASYAPEEVDTSVIRDARLLHVGSLSLGTPVSAAAQRLAVATARDAGKLVSADPNLRPSVWRDPEAMVVAGREAVAGADIVKVSEEELVTLARTDDAFKSVRRLWHPDLRVMAVTKGLRGADIYTGDWVVQIDGFAVNVVDTVGCGDAFMASLLAGLLAADLSRLDRATVAAIGQRATAAGAVMATKAGAMTRMPRPQEIDTLIAMRHLETT